MQLYMITSMGARVVGDGISKAQLIDLADKLVTLDRAIPAARIIRVRYEIRTTEGQVVEAITA